MSFFHSTFFTTFKSENDDFRTFHLLNNRCFQAAFNKGMANFNIFVIFFEQNFFRL